MEEEQIMYKINPKFNFIYELTMPLGRKFRTDLLLILVFLIATISLNIYGSTWSQSAVLVFTNINIITIIKYICYIGMSIVILKLLIDLLLRIMQYRSMSYTFYNDSLVYEDSFLNQQRKVIKYENVKEVEIRRTVWDRIMGFGIIIISTNAEGNHTSGLVIYGISSPNEHYEKINKLIYTKNTKKDNNLKSTIYEKEELETKKSEGKYSAKEELNTVTKENENKESFKESLKNIK